MRSNLSRLGGPCILLSVLAILAGPLALADEPAASPSDELSPAATVSQNPKGDALQPLRTAVDAGSMQTAYETAIRLAPEWEGDETFDLLYGLAALESGHPETALFCFERLHAGAPDNLRYRLEYARTLFVLEQDVQARLQFEAVLKQDVPPRVQENVAAFLRAIDEREQARRQHWDVRVGLGGGYDSNINNATTERFIGVFELPESALEQESPFASVQTQVDYREVQNQRESWTIGWDSQHKANTVTSDFDLDAVRLQLRYQHTAAISRWEWAMGYQHVLLSGEAYQRSLQTSLRWTRVIDNAWLFSLQGLLARRDSFEEALLNNVTVLLNGELTRSEGEFLHRGSFALGSERPRDQAGKPQLRDFAMLAYRLDYRVADRVTPWVALNLLQARYQAVNPTFGVRREDASRLASVGLDYQIHRNWTVTAQFGVTDNDSRIDLYDYRRRKFELAAFWQY